MFYTALAVQAAPLIILSVLALLPFTIVLVAKLVKGVKLMDALWQIWRWLKKLKHKNETHHHYHTSPYKQIHHPHPHPHHGWNSHFGWKPHTGWRAHYYRKQDEQAHVPDEYESTPTAQTAHDTQNGYPASQIGDLVHSTYGDHFRNRADEEEAVTEGITLDDTELDTAHNRKVMEILMETKNATLQKLLESWEINFPTPAEDGEAETETTTKSKRRRKRRRRAASFERDLQIPASTAIN